MKIMNFDDVNGENTITHNVNCQYTLDHAYRILIIGGSRSGKANALINLIIHEPYIDRIYL